MTMRAVLMVGGTLACVLIGALLAAVILTAITLDEHGARIDATRERLIRDEIAFCSVLRLSPDSEQSRGIAELARAQGDTRLADAAIRSAELNRLPARCER